MKGEKKAPSRYPLGVVPQDRGLRQMGKLRQKWGPLTDYAQMEWPAPIESQQPEDR